MDTEKYLRRIGVENFAIPASAESLKHLQKRHLLSVPFENLDIHWKRPILLSVESFYEKIVGERRGGFCYELNGLFAELLNELGFPSRMISARVSTGKRAGDYFEVVKKEGADWKSEYIFKDSAHDLADYAGMCGFHQTSPDSHFTRGRVCSIMLEAGRKTLTDKKFIETGNGTKSETEVNSEAEFAEILYEEFQIKAPAR
jgi:N-hydroxyarylamine O-acetyltransferase